MSRSGYTDDYDEDGALAMWRGVIASATRGKRGQQFFRDLVTALDAMPAKRLVSAELETTDGEVCALGALARAKGVDMEAMGEAMDDRDYGMLGGAFNIASQLTQEVMWENDEAGPYGGETPEQRWERVRAWAEKQIRKPREALVDGGTP